MPRNMKICVVCLRADRRLKIIDKRLSGFHVELCEAVESTKFAVRQYCFECEYLLKKMYNFKAKCVLAIKILRDWKRSKSAGKKPVEMIYTLLPPPSLGLWSNDKATIFTLREIGFNELDSTMEEGSKSNGSNFHNIVVPMETVRLQYYADVNTEEQKQERKQSKDSIKLHYKCEETELEFNDPIYLKIEDSASDITNNDNGFQSDEAASENDLKVLNIINNLQDDTGTDVGLSDDNVNIHSDDSSEGKLSFKIETVTKRSFAELDNIISQDHDGDATLKEINVNKRTKPNKMTNAGSKKLKSPNIGDDDDDKEKMVPLDHEILKRTNVKGFSKERLKDKVTEQFELCGELKTEDGSTIDKQLIMKCLDDKVTEHIMKKLWNTIRGKSPKPSSRTLNLYKYIQDKFTSVYESVFEIEYLNTKKKMLEEFQKRKTYSCYLDAKFKCELCYQGFKHEKQFENHKKCHDKSAGDFVCSICNIPKKSKNTLKYHIHHTHGAVYKCKLCPFLTYYRYIMKNHFSKHKGEVYNCEACGKKYKSRSAYYAHVGLRHNTQYVCTTCGRVYLTQVGLETHKAGHKNEPPSSSDRVSCPQCDLEFPSESVLEKHLIASHSTRIKKQHDSTSTKTKLYSKRKQRARSVHTCRVCNAVGDSIGWLLLHFRMEHPDVDMDILYADKKPNLCDVCGRGFASVHSLRHHMRNHTGERPFACTVCPKRFRTYANMRNHRLWHFPPRQVCGVCAKKFHSTANLYNHMQIHIGNRRHKCSICDKGFIHRHALNEHVNGVHNNIKRNRITRGAKKRQAVKE